jgi:prepilin-type processing-associated H-X9-DG protein
MISQAQRMTQYNLAAFTRLDLLALLCALALLTLLQFPGWAKSRETGNKAACLNQLRQVNLALLTYSADNDDLFPPRLPRPFWPERLRPYYKDTKLLLCPSDATNAATAGSDPVLYPADSAPRSYLFNGWSDYFPTLLPGAASLPEKAILRPNATITFGEKASDSIHFYFDQILGDDLLDLEQGRHDRLSADSRTGGSNFAFADGSVRSLPFGGSLTPVNLWAITDAWRNFPLSPTTAR